MSEAPLHPTPCTLRPTPDTLNPTTYITLHPEPQTLNSKPQTLHSTTYTLHRQPQTFLGDLASRPCYFYAGPLVPLTAPQPALTFLLAQGRCLELILELEGGGYGAAGRRPRREAAGQNQQRALWNQQADGGGGGAAAEREEGVAGAVTRLRRVLRGLGRDCGLQKAGILLRVLAGYMLVHGLLGKTKLVPWAQCCHSSDKAGGSKDTRRCYKTNHKRGTAGPQ